MKAKATPGAVRLTDDSGDTYVWDGTSNRKISTSADSMVAVNFQIKIQYTGSLNVHTDIEALWAASFNTYENYKVDCWDSTNYASTTEPANGNSPKAIHDAVATGKRFGVKFGSVNAGGVTKGASEDTINHVEVDLVSADLSALPSKTFTDDGLVDWFDVTTSTSVGVCGIDSFEQKASDSYEASFQLKFSAKSST